MLSLNGADLADSEDPAGRKHTISRRGAPSGVPRLLRYVLAVAAIVVAWDALLFRSGLYYRWVEPRSTAGTTRSAIRVVRGSYEPGRRNVLVLGNSRIGEGFSSLLADEATADTGLHFINAAIPGTDPRVWYYVLREIDPRAERFAALVVPIRYDPVELSAPSADYPLDIAYLAPLLRLTDIVDFPSSFDDPTLQQRARRAILFPAQPMRDDMAALLASPSQRRHEVRESRRRHLGDLLRYGGRAEALPDLALDPDTLQLLDWQGREAELKPKLSGYFAALSSPHSGEAARASNERYYRQWLRRIADVYRANGVPVIAIEVPRGPFHGAHAATPTAAGTVAELAAAGLLILLPGDSFVDLEQPRYFFDDLHMNRAGREQFSPRLARLVAAALH